MNKLFAAAALALAVTAVHAETGTSGREALVKRCQADATAQGKKGISWQEQVNACVKQGKAAQEAAAQACSAQAQGRNDAQFLQAQKDCLARAGQSPE